MSEGTRTPAVARAVKWSAVTTVARFGLQLGAQVALARMLGPGNYGVYGIALTILTFAAFLSGASFSWSLLLQPSVSNDDIRFSFTWQLAAGLLTATAIYLLAPFVAAFFADPRLVSVVRWIALASLLAAATAPATCLLQRELNFKALGLIQLAGYGAGYVGVGIPMALLGYGAISLALACVVQAAVTLVCSYAVRPHPVRPLFFYSGALATLVTGRRVFITNVVNWSLGNLDRIIIGRMLNASSVGLYTVAYNLATIPNTLLLGVLQPTLLAVGSRLQQDPQRLTRAWLQALSIILVLVTPAAVVAALLATDLIGLLYGPEWAGSAWILALLLLCLPAWACWGMSTPILWNTGRQHYEYQVQLPLLALGVGAWVLVADQGIRAVAVVSAAVILARAGAIVAVTLSALQLRWRAVLDFVARGSVLAAAGALAVMAARHAVAGMHQPALSLLSGGASALFAMALLVGLWPQVLGAEAKAAILNLFPGLGLRWAALQPRRPEEAR